MNLLKTISKWYFLFFFHGVLFAENSSLSLESKLSNKRTSQGNLLWEDRNWQLRQLNPKANLTDPDTKFLVVKFLKKSTSAQLISRFPKIALHEQYDQDTDIAVLEFQNLSEINEIAQLVHNDFESCGMLQVLGQNFTTKEISSLSPPLYSPLATLSSISTLVSEINIANIEQTITTMSDLFTRHHSTGVTVSNLVQELFEAVKGIATGISIQQFDHTSTSQKSVIARIEGTIFPEETIIIGAHLDSINRSGISQPAPGADDDATGVAILIELFRILAQGNYKFSRSIEFQAYAAEEVGLVGSGDIAKSYTQVTAMMQIDMAMYGINGNDGIIHLVRDDTSANLNRNAVHFIKNYLGTKYSQGFLPRGASSDHRSFYQNGFPTLFPFEDIENHNEKIHSANDLIAELNNPDLANNIGALGLAFLSHYAGLVNAQNEYSSLKNAIYDNVNSDLFIAGLADQDNPGQFYISASAPEETAAIEYCGISSGEDIDCLKPRRLLESNLSRASRLIFYELESLAMTSGDRFRIWAYDADDNLIQKRDVEISLNP